MSAILDFANMAAPGGTLLGARQKLKEYELGDLCANVRLEEFEQKNP